MKQLKKSAPSSAKNPRFAPSTVHRPQRAGDAVSEDVGDQRTAPVYVYHPSIVLAVNVALATGRPLLVRGASGTGKSTLARNAADVLGWRYYEEVITSRTQARDLLWRIDLVRRLHEAQRQGGTLSDDYTPFVEPGILWWAFAPQTAARRGSRKGRKAVSAPAHPVQGRQKADRAVVLLDEIDKADPDVPNNLLVPLGSLLFQVEETGVRVQAERSQAPLVVITTNGERDLPAAFLRRCVALELPPVGLERLVEILRAHFPELDLAEARAHVQAVVDCFPECKQRLEEASKREPSASTPEAPVDLGLSPAEVVDAVRAARSLDIPLAGPEWSAIVSSCTSSKQERRP